MKSISDIMTTAAISVTPDTSIIEAANLLIKHGFNGLPVVDASGRLVGILTEYDFILKKSDLHLLTIIKIFQDVDIYKKDAGSTKEDLKKLLNLNVSDIMNREPLTLSDTALPEDAVKAFEEHHRVNPILVTDRENHLKGIVSRHDILKFFGTDSRDLTSESIEAQADQFVRHVGKKFVLVSKARTNWWLIASLLFALAGFAVAWLLILRVNL